MKKVICILLLSVLLTACNTNISNPTISPTETETVDEIFIVDDSRPVYLTGASSQLQRYEPTVQQIINISEETTEETIIETEEIPTTAATLIFSTMWTTTNLNLRVAPEADIICVLPQGTEIIALDYCVQSEWTNVNADGVYGFVATQYLSFDVVEPLPHYDYYYIVEGGITSEMDHAWQEYGQDLIRSLGMEEYIPYWMCQCYQETSSLTMGTPNSYHGGYYDWGLMQIWEGHQYDVWSPLYSIIQSHLNYKTDPYDNIYCGIYQFYQWYVVHNGNIAAALGSYFSGTATPDAKYINDVMSHWGNLYIR